MSTDGTYNKEMGADIVAITRKARFADTPPEEWARRLTALIQAQSDVRGNVVVSNVRQVGTAAGGSNGTLLFDAAYDTAEGRAERNLVLRFLPAQGLFHRYDVTAQYRLQRALERTDVPVPPQLWLDADGTHLTRPGYVMAQVPGVSPAMTWRTSGIIADASPASRRAMTLDMVHTQARLHALDRRALGLTWP